MDLLHKDLSIGRWVIKFNMFFFWSITSYYLYSVRMIWNIQPFWIMFFFIFICIIIKINHFVFTYSSSSVLHTSPAFVLLKICNILSSLLLSAILLISSVYTLCASLLNLRYDFNMMSLFNKQFLSSLNLSSRFITHFVSFSLFITIAIIY